MAPEVNWDDVDEFDDFTPIPEGRYLCEAVDVEERFTKGGDEMWNVRWEVLEGECKGRTIFDNIVWSEKAKKRVKMIFKRLGLNTSGSDNPSSSIIIGKQIYIDTTIEDYETDEGQTKQRNIVPYAGYIALDASNKKESKSSDKKTSKKVDDDLPF